MTGSLGSTPTGDPGVGDVGDVGDVGIGVDDPGGGIGGCTPIRDAGGIAPPEEIPKLEGILIVSDGATVYSNVIPF